MYLAVDELYNDYSKQVEREAIWTLVSHNTTLGQVTQKSIQSKLAELSEAMYDKSQTELPSDLEAGLTGKAGDAGKTYLKAIKKLTSRSPVIGV